MKKITLLVILCLFTVTAQAKEKLGIVFAGSLGGSFNKFNSALVKDLSKWYDIEEISTGGSSTKGGKIFSSINDRPVFMMSETAKRNVVNAIKGKGPFVNGVSSENLVWGGKYYKSLCTVIFLQISFCKRIFLRCPFPRLKSHYFLPWFL